MVAKWYNRRWEDVDKSDIPLESIFKSYELFNRSEGKSERTVVWYDEKLHEYARWLETNGYPTTLSEFEVDRVREYILSQQARDKKFERNPFAETRPGKLAAETIRGCVRTLKAFASWLYEEGYTDWNVLQRYRLPRAQKKEPVWLTQEEMERVLAVFDRKTTMGARDYAIVVTFLDTGLRCRELCGLELANADLDVGELKVLGKGNKERTVPVGVRAVRALRRYRDHFRPPIEAPQFFFSVDGRPLSVHAVQCVVLKAKQKTGIARLHPHLLRHTFAIHYLMAGGDVFSLQKILGHSTLEVTRMYVNMVSSQVKEKHRLYSPMDNLPLKSERGGKKPVRDGARLWRVR